MQLNLVFYEVSDNRQKSRRLLAGENHGNIWSTIGQDNSVDFSELHLAIQPIIYLS